MSAPSSTALTVSLPEAFAALEDHRFIASCTRDLHLDSSKGDGVARGSLTHVQGDAHVTYQLTLRVIETCADDHRVRYQLRAREQAGGSLAALTIDATLSIVDGRTTLALEPHLVLAGYHGGIPYPDLRTALTRAVEVLSARVAGLLSDPSVLASISSPSEADSDPLVPRSSAHHPRPRALAGTRAKDAALIMAAVGLSLAGYLFLRRSRRTS